MTDKKPTKKYNKPSSYRFPKKITDLIGLLKDKLSISKTAIVTLAILEFAEKYGIKDKSQGE